jgi:hypothetical protein
LTLETLERNIRSVLATGYEQRALPEACKDLPRCDTPVDLPHLVCAHLSEATSLD